jgi:hypothetical protein
MIIGSGVTALTLNACDYGFKVPVNRGRVTTNARFKRVLRLVDAKRCRCIGGCPGFLPDGNSVLVQGREVTDARLQQMAGVSDKRSLALRACAQHPLDESSRPVSPSLSKDCNSFRFSLVEELVSARAFAERSLGQVLPKGTGIHGLHGVGHVGPLVELGFRRMAGCAGRRFGCMGAEAAHKPE